MYPKPSSLVPHPVFHRLLPVMLVVDDHDFVFGDEVR
jgi:hypothetical protein